MSVINSVLKDLENKPSSFTPLDVAELSVEKRSARFSYSHRVLVILVVLLSVVGIWFANNNELSFFAKKPEQTASVKSEALQKPGTVAVSTPNSLPETQNKLPVVANINEISGLQINETPQYLELEFQLTQKAQSFLKSRGKNNYVFSIKDTRSVIISPAISDNPWLSRVEIFNTDPGVEIQFNTRQGVLVETRDIERLNKHFWLIRFKTPQVKPLLKTDKAIDKPVKNTIAKKSEENKTDAPLPLKSPARSLSEQEVKLDIRPVKTEISDAQLFQEALRAFDAGQWSQAEKGFNDLLGGEQDREARIKLIALYQLQKNTDQKHRLLDESIRLYADDLNFILLEANRLFAASQYAELIKRYADNPQNIQLYSLVAASYQRLGQHQKAVEKYLQALEQDPMQSKLWVSLAISQQHQRQPEQALQSFRMALKSGRLNERLKSFVNQRIRQLSN